MCFESAWCRDDAWCSWLHDLLKLMVAFYNENKPCSEIIFRKKTTEENRRIALVLIIRHYAMLIDPNNIPFYFSLIQGQIDTKYVFKKKEVKIFKYQDSKVRFFKVSKACVRCNSYSLIQIYCRRKRISWRWTLLCLIIPSPTGLNSALTYAGKNLIHTAATLSTSCSSLTRWHFFRCVSLWANIHLKQVRQWELFSLVLIAAHFLDLHPA